MKILLTSLTFILLFSSCADKTAFSKFNMTQEQELAASSLQSSKIVLGESVNGVVSVLYLNEIHPEMFKENEFFYISLYLKEEKQKFTITLNGKEPLAIEKLPHANKFSHLLSTENEWNSYYLVHFKNESLEVEQNSKNLLDETNTTKEKFTFQPTKEFNLQLESGQFSSAVLKYRKAKQ